MAKTLIEGQTIENQYGDKWDAAILVVDNITIDFHAQILYFNADIYKDESCRTSFTKSIRNVHTVEKEEYLANFNILDTIFSLKEQAENYVLTLTNERGDKYGDKFE